MLTLVANHKSWWIHYWCGKGHSQDVQLLGHIWSPGGTITVYPELPYALDNGRYAIEENGGNWDGDRFLDHCDQIRHLSKPPLWIVAPDRRRDAAATLELWREWEPQLRKYQVPLAFVLQDGIRLEDIPETAGCLFVGGSDQWRYPLLPEIVTFGKATHRPVHVGRVNGDRLWQCHRIGVTSTDGSGYHRGDPKQLAKLERYLNAQLGLDDIPHHYQLGLFSNQTDHQSYFILFRPHGNRSAVESHNANANNVQLGYGIPRNITRDHLLKAIENWFAWGQVPIRQRSQKYAVEHDGAIYPVKLLISRANAYANGYVLCPRSFSGGVREANRFMQQRGFNVVSLETLLQAS